MNEITEDEYNSSGCYDFYTCDTLMDYLYSEISGEVYMFGAFWNNSGQTQTGINVWNNCTDFTTTKNTYGITVGSSTRFGASPCIPTPTPTPTGPTATPTPTPTGTPTPTPTITPTPTPSPTPYTGEYYFYTYSLINCPCSTSGSIAGVVRMTYRLGLGEFYRLDAATILSPNNQVTPQSFNLDNPTFTGSSTICSSLC